ALTPVVPLISSFKASEGLFILSSNMIPTISGHVANLLAIPAFYSTRPIMGKLAPVAQRKPSHYLESCHEVPQYISLPDQTPRETFFHTSMPTPKSVSHHLHEGLPRHAIGSIMADCLNMGVPPC
nr:hypothetical protein [Tanacetum cinerariifolium]